MPHKPLDCPRLRWPLATEDFEHNGSQYLVLRDPQGVAEKPALIPIPLVPVISRFNGNTTLESIVNEAGSFGLTMEMALRLADDLDEMCFLDTPATQKKFRELERDFFESPVRREALAGAVYPAEPGELKAALEKYLAGAENTFEKPSEQAELVGLVCPHIDYARGWRTYASAYSALERSEAPDVVMLLGTSHSGGRSIYQLTRKDFQSPLGTFTTAQPIVDRLVSVMGENQSFRDEYLHKREHSLELQLPFLAYRYRNGDRPEIVPILVGSFHHFLEKQISPVSGGEVADFVGALAEVTKGLRAAGRRVLFYGGVDLAHVGMHFGDEERMDDAKLEVVRSRDRELLDAVLAGDEERLFAHMAEDCDKRRICGFPSMYTMLAAMRRAGIQLHGHFIEYRQAVDRQSDCVVTFASACWTVG
ncbi:MAG: AmmeMemoRadiSam system protein B [Bdellovibrionota bacterium]